MPSAVALVGPPLDSWSRRSFIADELQIRPGSAMPQLDLDEQQIADIVAYLFDLE